MSCVRLLVEHKANVNITCRDGRNVLDYIISEYGDERIDIFTYLLTNLKPQKQDDGRVMTYIHKACLAGKKIAVEKIVGLLIARGANLNAVEGKGR